MATLKFFVTLERDENGWYVADCPDLPGCASQGRSREEAINNIREAIAASLQTRAEAGLSTMAPPRELIDVEVSSAAG